MKGSVKRHIFLEKGILLWVTSGFIAGFSLHEHKEPFDTEQRRLSSLEVSGSAFYSWRACILNQMGTCLHDMSFPSPLTYLPKEIDVPVRLILKRLLMLTPRPVGRGWRGAVLLSVPMCDACTCFSNWEDAIIRKSNEFMLYFQKKPPKLPKKYLTNNNKVAAEECGC